MSWDLKFLRSLKFKKRRDVIEPTLDKNSETFVVHIIALEIPEKIPIYPLLVA